jgi:hypothetical protein
MHRKEDKNVRNKLCAEKQPGYPQNGIGVVIQGDIRSIIALSEK